MALQKEDARTEAHLSRSRPKQHGGMTVPRTFVGIFKSPRSKPLPVTPLPPLLPPKAGPPAPPKPFVNKVLDTTLDKSSYPFCPSYPPPLRHEARASPIVEVIRRGSWSVPYAEQPYIKNPTQKYVDFLFVRLRKSITLGYIPTEGPCGSFAAYLEDHAPPSLAHPTPVRASLSPVGISEEVEESNWIPTSMIDPIDHAFGTSTPPKSSLSPPPIPPRPI